MTTSHLVPCSSCQRHVRVSEATCPFCRAAIPASLRGRAAPVMPATRLARAAIFALGAMGAGATAAAGCGGSTAAGTGTGNSSGPDASEGSDAGEGSDSSTFSPPYGAFPPVGDASDDGNETVVAAYGGAAIIDSGLSGDGGEAGAAADAAVDAHADGGHNILPAYGFSPPYGGVPAPDPNEDVPPAEKPPAKETTR